MQRFDDWCTIWNLAAKDLCGIASSLMKRSSFDSSGLRINLLGRSRKTIESIFVLYCNHFNQPSSTTETNVTSCRPITNSGEWRKQLKVRQDLWHDSLPMFIFPPAWPPWEPYPPPPNPPPKPLLKPPPLKPPTPSPEPPLKLSKRCSCRTYGRGWCQNDANQIAKKLYYSPNKHVIYSKSTCIKIVALLSYNVPILRNG